MRLTWLGSAILLSALISFVGFSAEHASAQTLNPNESEMTALIAKMQTAPIEFASRLDLSTRHFLGRPYLENGPLGEGPGAEFDEDPLYRADGFDCTTFVETNLALARSRDFPDFLSQLLAIRYLNGQVAFQTRNHFTEIDWNPNNEHAGLVRDITESVGAPSDLAWAQNTISKKAWYEALPATILSLPGISASEVSLRLNELHHLGDAMPDQVSNLAFIPKKSLLKIAAKLPKVAIFNILRNKRVGHQVIYINLNGIARIREASSISSVMHVTDMSFTDYVKSLIQSPSTDGVNILEPLAR